jgi:hypothetical protein
VASRAAPASQIPPPPLALTEASRAFADSAVRLRGDVSAESLAELEDILAGALASDGDPFAAGWSNCASYLAACGVSDLLDPADPLHLPLILAQRDKRAVLARLGLSAVVQFSPRDVTVLRPFPLAPLGDSLGGGLGGRGGSALPVAPSAPLPRVRLVLPADSDSDCDSVPSDDEPAGRLELP